MWRSAARALVVLGLGVGTLEPQAAICGASPKRGHLFDTEWFAFPEVLVPFGRHHFVSGTATNMVRLSADTQLVAFDTIMDGFIARGASAPLAVKPVIKGRYMLYARVLPIHRDTLLVVFQSSPVRVWDHSSTDSVEVFSARLASTGWHGVRRVATLAPGVHLERGWASDLVRLGERWIIAFGSPPPQGGKTTIGLLNVSTDSSWVEHLDFDLHGASYVDLAVHEGTPWLAFVGLVHEPRFAGIQVSYQASVFDTRLTSRGWTPLRRVLDGHIRMLHRPRLIPRADGLLLAWIEDVDGGARLRWKGISPGADTAMQDLPDVFLSERGYPPFDHVMGITSASQATILVPRPGGMDLIARVPISKGIPPLVGGTFDDPYLLVVVPVSKPQITAQLVAYSLKCGLPALLGNPPR